MEINISKTGILTAKDEFQEQDEKQASMHKDGIIEAYQFYEY